MSYSILSRLLTDPNDLKFLNNLTSGRLQLPYLLETTLMYMNDNNSRISDQNRESLFKLTKTYFNACFVAYIDQSSATSRLEKLIEGAHSTVYYTTTPYMDRVATENEVNNGIAELRADVTNNISEEVERYLNLLMWTFSGLVRYYIRAGFKATYQDNRLIETPYQLIQASALCLKDMVAWMSEPGNYDKTITILREAIKAGKSYRYPTFATDEITPDISAKQIIYLCDTKIRGNGATETQFNALNIIRRHKKNARIKLKPFEIATLRRAYAEIQDEIVDPEGEELDPVVGELCEEIDRALEDGIISSNEFALKIVKTVRQRIRCSDKQLNILMETKSKIDKKRAEIESSDFGDITNKATKNTESSELLGISDALGSGVLAI